MLTSSIFDAIRPRYLAWLLALGFGVAFSLLAFALSVTAIFSGRQIVIGHISPSPFSRLAGLRCFTYGGGFNTVLAGSKCPCPQSMKKWIALLRRTLISFLRFSSAIPSWELSTTRDLVGNAR